MEKWKNEKGRKESPADSFLLFFIFFTQPVHISPIRLRQKISGQEETGVKNGTKRRRGLLVLAVAAIVIVVAVVIIVPRIGKTAKTQKQETRQNTVVLSKMDLTRSVSATGTLASIKTKIVRADVSDVKVKKVLVKVGDKVKKGQSLVTFDKSTLQEALAEAKDNLSDVKSQNSSELAAARRKLAEAQESYESMKKKQKQAKSSGGQTTAGQTNEDMETSLQQSKSNVQSAKDALTTTQNNQKKSLREAQKLVDDAEEALKVCSATASMEGTVTAIGVEAGDSYRGGDLAEISDCTSFQVSTTVDEYDISDISKGQKVVILTDATGETELEGKITYVAPTTGSTLDSSGSSDSTGSSSSMGSAASGSSGYEVRIRVKTSNEKLRVGMTAKCSIILEEASDVYAVPYDAIHTNTNGESVLYVQDSSGTRSETAVTKGMESDYYVEVSGDGLSEGLRILIPTDETSSDSDEESKQDSGSLDSLLSGGKEDRKGHNRQERSFGDAPGGAPGGKPGM